MDKVAIRGQSRQRIVVGRLFCHRAYGVDVIFRHLGGKLRRVGD